MAVDALDGSIAFFRIADGDGPRGGAGRILVRDLPRKFTDRAVA